MSRPRPWSWMEWMAGRTRPAGLSRQSTLGDLAEEFAERARTSAVRARLWYLGQVLSLFGHRLFGSAGGARRIGRFDPRPDLRWAVRSLVRRPALSLAVIGVLGLGLGSNVAVFSVVAGTLERTSWWADPDRAVELWPGYRFSLGQLDLLQSEQTLYRAVGGWEEAAYALQRPDGGSESVTGVRITPELFRQLEVQPVLGRALTDDDALVGTERVVVISERLWRDFFSADPSIVGRRVEVAGQPATVVGVQGAGARVPTGRTDLWLPMVMDPREDDYWPSYAYTVHAVMDEGVTLEQANADLVAWADRLGARFPMFFPADWAAGAHVTRADEAQRRLVDTPLRLLFGGTALLLLVTALNVGNLLVGRAVDRRAELDVRAALGAGRGRIVGQLLLEGTALTALALGLGLAAASWGSRAIEELFATEPVIGRAPVLSGAVMPFALGVATLAWLVLNGVPIAHFLRRGRGGLGRAPASSANVRRTLVVLQSALATLLLVSAALLVSTVDNLRSVPLGFDPRGLMTVALSPPEDRVASPAAARDLYGRLVDRVSAVGGVRDVGLTGWLPLRSAAPVAPVNLEDAPVQVHESLKVPKHHVDAGFFRALGVDAVEGRLLGSEDGASSPSAVVVNRSLAERLWPGQSAVGKRVAIDPHAWDSWVPVVGVVPDIRSEQITGPVSPALYVALGEDPTRDVTLVIRGSAAVGEQAAAIRQAVAEVDPLVPVRTVTDMTAVVRSAYSTAWVMMGLLVVLAVLASLLGALGINAVLVHHVAANRRELAVRMALGARPAEVVGSVVRSGLVLAAAGIAVGSLVAGFTNRMLGALLFEVSTLAPGAFAAPLVVLVLAAGLAAWVPAMRAGRMAPAEVLRDE